MSPKCPSCSKLITYVVASPVSITTPQGNIEGYCFLCPSCKAAISCQIDPVLLREDLVQRLRAELKGQPGGQS